MPANTSEQTIQSIEIFKNEQIAASIEVVFETILEQMGPLNQHPDGSPLTMKLEPWPGGRWYRATWATTPATSGVMCRPSNRRCCLKSAGRCSCRMRPPPMCSTGWRRKMA